MSVVPDLRTSDGCLYDRIYRLLKSFPKGDELRVLILTHRQGDPDALCAAGALKLLLEQVGRELNILISIGVPQGASVLGKQVSTLLDIQFSDKLEESSFTNSDLLFVVDTGDSRLLDPYAGMFQANAEKKFLIDHHASSLAPESWSGIDDRVVVTTSTSTCQIIALGFPKKLITKKIADILLTGLLFDSQHLGIATKDTLEAALILVEGGAEISRCKKLLHHNPDRSEILGKIKAAQRMRYEEVAGKIIARSEISSYHASVARMLVEIGADVGIAYGETGGEARLSARSSQSFFKETGIDLSEEIKKVARHFDMVGGGHSTAASVSGKIEAGVVADFLVMNLKGTLLQK
jgi:nanoRNase/pAp phosphatase (c-di-AMP/oligoRNAs hydrolase)